MHGTSLHQESNPSMPNSKLFGVVIPILGAVFGVLFFLILLLLFRQIIQSELLLWAALLWPGLLITLAIWDEILRYNISSAYTFIIYSISGVPFAVIGSLVVSKKKITRISGLALFVIYLLASIVLGMGILVLGDI